MPKKEKQEKEEWLHRSKKERDAKLSFELKRKAVHALVSIYLIMYWVALRYFGFRVAILVLLGTLLFFIIIDFFRIAEHKRIPIVHILWRQKEENSLGGQVYIMIGMIIALASFEFSIAVAVILMTIFGDMAAALFGIRFGRTWIKGLEETAWEGVIAEFVVDLFIGWLVVGNWMIFIPMAFMATLVETIFPHVDDNLAIPVFAGFTGQCLMLIIF